ncbi:MAG: acyl-CoA thioesterase [Luteibaculaceae bacterium]
MKFYTIEVRYADIDTMNHVNNAVYFSYFEVARIKFFKDVVGSNWNWKKHGIILVRNEIDYIKPVFLTDKIRIGVGTESIGGKSFTLLYLVQKEVNGEWINAAQGKSVSVCFDHELKTTIEVPETWREILTSIKV